jgi:hypothetical protein
MADELTIISGWTLSKLGVTRQYTPESETFDVTGNSNVENVQSIGTVAHEALVKGDIGTCGFLYARNTDATNFVQIGYDDTGTFRPFVKLAAGQSCQLWCNADPYAQANTGAVRLSYKLVEL